MTGSAPDPTAEVTRPNTWWRRNRWALLALPLALGLVLVTGAGRIVMFWLPYELTDRVAGGFGESISFTDDYRDAEGMHERIVDIAVTSVSADPVPTDGQGEPVADHAPAGTRLWEVELRIEADPDMVLDGCVIGLVDAQGRVTERDTTLFPWSTSLDGCQPVDSVNPSMVLFEGMTTEPSTRPPAYTRTAQLLAAEDFEPVEVRVWWEPPTYLAVPLPDAGR